MTTLKDKNPTTSSLERSLVKWGLPRDSARRITNQIVWAFTTGLGVLVSLAADLASGVVGHSAAEPSQYLLGIGLVAAFLVLLGLLTFLLFRVRRRRERLERVKRLGQQHALVAVIMALSNRRALDAR